MREDKSGVYVFQNENGREMVDLCAERCLCMDYSDFKCKYVHKYTSVVWDRNRMEVNINLVWVRNVVC